MSQENNGAKGRQKDKVWVVMTPVSVHVEINKISRVSPCRNNMSQVATYRICVSKGTTSSDILYARNPGTEDSTLLACHPAYHRGVWGVTHARSACSRGRGQYNRSTQAVWSRHFYQPHRHTLAYGKIIHNPEAIFRTAGPHSFVSRWHSADSAHHIPVGPMPSSSPFDGGWLFRTPAASLSGFFPRFFYKYYRPSASRSLPSFGNLTNYSQECLVQDVPASIAFTSFPLCRQLPLSPTAIWWTRSPPSSYLP